jgi:hypothetical protein
MTSLDSKAFSSQLRPAKMTVNGDMVGRDGYMAFKSGSFEPVLSLEAVTSAIMINTFLWLIIGILAKQWLV